MNGSHGVGRSAPRPTPSGGLSACALVLSTLLAGCVGGEPGAAVVVAERDSAGVRIVEIDTRHLAELPSWRLDPTPEAVIGEALGAPEYELHDVAASVRLPDGSIAVANAGTAQVQLYDAQGRHRATLGGRGGGPGEFAWLAWVGVDADGLITAYDDRNRRLSWFDPDGSFIRDLTLDAAAAGGFPRMVGWVGDRALTVSGFDLRFAPGERRDTVSIFLHDAAGKVTDSLGGYPGEERFFYVSSAFATTFRPIFGRTAAVHTSAGGTAAGATDHYAFDVFDGAALRTRVRSVAESIEGSPAAADAERRQHLDRLGRLPRDLRSAIAEDVVHDLPVRETLPGFSDLRVDDRGRVWVRDYAPDHVAADWTVFDPDGRPVARLRTPDAFDVHHFADDRVIGRARDEDGIERVLVFRVRAPE